MKSNGKKRSLRKTTVREIRGSFGRFFAIFAIIALGVGFFCGVRLTKPFMVRTIDNFYRENAFYDYRLLSTIGWEAQDVAAFLAEDGVRAAAGAFQYDVICTTADGLDVVYKAHSLTEGVNGVLVREGRLPMAADEVLLDSLYPMGLSIGDELVLSEANDEDTLAHFCSRRYTVVGFGSSSLYINFERGTTSLGNGSVSGFFYLTEEGFDEDTYTELYVKLASDEEIYSDAYTQRMDAQRGEWEDLLQETADARYDRLYEEAETELQDARDTLEEERANGQAELDDAAAELDDGKAELDDALQTLTDTKAELDDAAAQLADGKAELDEAHAELADAQATLDSPSRRTVRRPCWS